MIKRDEPIREQNSIFFFSGREELPKPFTDFYVHLFLEDISRRIVPLRRRGRDLKLEGGDAQSQGLIANAVSSHDHGNSFVWGVSEFLRMATSEMCAFDQAAFEIAYLRHPKSRAIEGFLFFHIDNRQLRWKRGRLFQIVPEQEARKRNVSTEIHLPLENMLIFSLSKVLKRQVTDLRSSLTQLSDSRFTAQVLEMSNRVPNYDFKDHERSLNLALAQSCYEIGWDVRGTFRDKTSGYLPIDSFLRFESFQIRMRELIFDLFNQALDSVRQKIPLKGRVIVENAPTNAMVHKASEDLKAGRDSFLKIMDRFRA
jgi:hypothetical protein